MKTRSDIMKVLKERFTLTELELLLLVPIGGDNVRRLAEQEGIGGEAIKARYKKVLRRLRRYLKKDEFELYKKAIGG